MKKILVTLLVLGILFSLALPTMAAENPVKDYESANNGDVLYEIDFSGADGVLTFANGGGQEADKHFIYTSSADGTSMSITGNPNSDDADGNFTGYYGALIEDLKATPKTVYSMTYKVKINGTAGKNNSIGFGGYYPTAGDTSRSYYLYGNFNTVDANGDTSMRRSALSIINSKLNEYTMWNTLPAYEIDADGYVTTMLVYDGPNALITAYIRAEGAGDGSKDTDWVKLDSTPMKQNDDKDDRYATLGVFYYSYYIKSVDAVVKDAKIYKGNLIGSTLSVSPVTPNTPNTPSTPSTPDQPVVKPTLDPNKASANFNPTAGNSVSGTDISVESLIVDSYIYPASGSTDPRPVNVDAAFKGTALKVGEQTFTQGFGLHPSAPSNNIDGYVTLDISGIEGNRFYSKVGITGTAAGTGLGVIFRVYGAYSLDGEYTLLASSGAVTGTNIGEFDVYVGDYKYLKLEVDTANDSHSGCASAFLDPVIYTGEPSPTGDTFSALPIALMALSAAAVAVIIKKKEN